MTVVKMPPAETISTEKQLVEALRLKVDELCALMNEARERGLDSSFNIQLAQGTFGKQKHAVVEFKVTKDLT